MGHRHSVARCCRLSGPALNFRRLKLCHEMGEHLQAFDDVALVPTALTAFGFEIGF
jgi:hypothetical protein